jgi:hypothetical protein
MTNFWNWISKSSTNPEETSLTAKSAMIALIPLILKASVVACGLHVCLAVDENSLTTLFSVLGDIVFWALSLYSGIGFVYGFVRKLILTAQGRNPIVTNQSIG